MISDRERQLFILGYIKSRLDGHVSGGKMLEELFDLSVVVFRELGIDRVKPETVSDFVKLNNEFTTIAQMITKQCKQSKHLQ